MKQIFWDLDCLLSWIRNYPGLDSLQTYWETKPEPNEEILGVVRLYHLNSHSPTALSTHGAKEGRQEVPHFPLLWQRTWRGRDQQGWGGGQTRTGSTHVVCTLNPGFAALKSELLQKEINTSINNVVSQWCKWVLMSRMSPRDHIGNEVLLWSLGPTREPNIEWVIGFSSLREEFQLSCWDAICFSEGWTGNPFLYVILNYLWAQILEQLPSLARFLWDCTAKYCNLLSN